MTGSIGDRWEKLSQALRRLRRDWAFSAAFVLTLALGIAANLAVFSALDAYFLRPLPYSRGSRLVDIYFGFAHYPGPPGVISAPAYELLRSAPALSASGLVRDFGNRTVAIPGEAPRTHRVAAVTASALETLAAQPLLGRWISPAGDRAGGPAEADLSYPLWQSAFHGDPHVLGRTLRIGGKQYTIVGVMPTGFAFPAHDTQLWMSAGMTAAALGLQRVAVLDSLMIARLRPDVSRVQLGAGLDSLLTRLEHSMPPASRGIFRQAGLYVASMPLRQWLGGATRGRLLMLQLGAGILLLLAVASLANLALARALRRREEDALRVMLGAGRRALLAQALLEALPLAVVATLIAWPLTDLGVKAFTHFGIAAPSTSFELHVGPALWALALAVACVLSSAALALPQTFVRVQRPADLLHGTGKGGGVGYRVRPLRLALSVGQIALAIVLLAGAVLLGRSLFNMLDPNPGFTSRGLYAAMVDLQGTQYETWSAWHDGHERLAAAVAALPGVRVSGIGEGVPFSGGNFLAAFQPAPARTGGALPPWANVAPAGPGLMKALGVRLLAGRLLDASDAATNSHNLVLDERYANLLFGRPTAVGKTLKCRLGTCRIVGVVGTIQDRFAPSYAAASGTVFVPEEPDTFRAWRGISTILIRSSVPSAVLAREVRDLVHHTLPDQSLYRFASMQELISDSAKGAAALASLLIAFGLLAFTLAIIGTYGVLAYVTGLRRRELAIRQIVGAQPIQIESLVIGQGVLLWLFGASIGVGCALVFARSMAAELYRVSLYSPATYALPAIAVGVAVMLASWVPARSARSPDLLAQIRPE
ncbi:MAG TPA: ABC transporter permease [Steroidobacteraceae bacterium]|nr:ABC transporter permease [Steroidobacteraceae bacterium]